MLTIIAFLFVLSLLVLVHEFGHYCVAKLAGIGVEQFSIGLPPRLFGITIGETDYRISAIPFGGYVKLVGQSDFDKEEDGEVGPRDYRGKPAWVRVAVLISGAGMNILTAVAIFFALFLFKGVPESSTRIGQVAPGTPAAVMGFLDGDEVLTINGAKVGNLDRDIIDFYTESSTSVTVRGVDGAVRSLELDRKIGQQEDLGLRPFLESRVDDVLPDSPAAQSGILSGDLITRLDDIAMTGGWYQMSQYIREHPGETITVTVERDGGVQAFPVTAGTVEEPGADGSMTSVGRIGITPAMAMNRVGPVAALTKSLDETGFLVVHTVDFFAKLVTGRMSSKLVGGPVLIAQMAGESAKSGFATLLGFTAFISVNLGVLNLLPFPVLDGGHIFIILVESIVRRKVSLKFRIALQQMGTIVLLLFMLYVTFNDVMRFPGISHLFGGG